MRLTVQRRLSSRLLNCGENRVRFDETRIGDIKEAITASDLRALVKEGAVFAAPVQGVSRGRARKIRIQKVKGRRRGHGSRKAPASARTIRKVTWMNKIRAQRGLLSQLREEELIDHETYSAMYRKAKGGFFRSKRHLRLYIEEQGLIREQSEGSQ
jgi:large subunit ribosomal protein L19e